MNLRFTSLWSCWCVLGAMCASASAGATATMFLLPVGGTGNEITIAPGETVVIEAFVMDVPQPVRGYTVQLPAQFAGSAGDSSIDFLPVEELVVSCESDADCPEGETCSEGVPGFMECTDCRDRDECNPWVEISRSDWVFFQVSGVFPVLDPNPPPRLVAARDSGGVFFQNTRYCGEFIYQASENASGTFTLDPMLPQSNILNPLGVEIPFEAIGAIVHVEGGFTIAHGEGPNALTVPCSGYVDPRFDSTNGVDINLGLTELQIAFSQSAFSFSDGGPVGPGDFVVTETGDETPPSVTDVTDISGNGTIFRVQLSRRITPQEWTTVRAIVQNASGTPIENRGDLGLENEPDRVDVAMLPGDINQSGNSSAVDIARARQFQLGICSPGNCPDCGGNLLYYDTNRGGNISAVDIARLRQLFLHMGQSTRSWNGARLNNLRP